jgi:phosphoenolpyruvate carboxylase
MISHWCKLEKSMNLLFDRLEDVLSSTDIKIAREYVEYNEFGIGFEHVCQQLFEYEIQISPEIFQEIESNGKSMELDEKTWSFLKILVKND